jgi:hypothetical protein
MTNEAKKLDVRIVMEREERMMIAKDWLEFVFSQKELHKMSKLKVKRRENKLQFKLDF